MLLVLCACAAQGTNTKDNAGEISSAPAVEITQAAQPTTVSADAREDKGILPHHQDKDLACGIAVKSSDRSNASFVFISDEVMASNLQVNYDLILPKSLMALACANGSRIDATLGLEYVAGTHEHMETVSTTYELNFSIAKSAEPAGSYVLEYENGAKQVAEELDNYISFVVQTSAQLDAAADQRGFIRLSQMTGVTADDVKGQLYFDNIEISSDAKKIVACDFNQRYGERGRQNVMTTTMFENSHMGYTHGLYEYVSEIDRSGQVPNTARVHVVMDGQTPVDGYDPNFSSMTVAFQNNFTLSEKMEVAFDLILPKTLFDACANDSAIYPGLDMVIDGNETGTTANCLLKVDDNGAPICCMDDDSVYTVGPPANGDAPIVIEEKADCYVFHFKGAVEYSSPKATEVWFKAKFSSERVVYSGDWYFANIRLSEGARDIIRYDIGKGPAVNNLVEFYSSTTNGIAYPHDQIVYGYAMVGLDYLPLSD